MLLTKFVGIICINLLGIWKPVL